MSQLTIKADPRRLGAIGANWLMPAPAANPGPAQRPVAPGDRIRISAAATASAGLVTRNGTIENQVNAIDAHASSLQANRDKVLASIRGLEGIKAHAMAQLATDTDKLTVAMNTSSTAQSDLINLRKAVVADQRQIEQISDHLATLRGRGSALSTQARSLGAAQRQDYAAAFGAKDYLGYLGSLKPAEVPKDARSAAGAEASGPQSAAAKAALAKDDAAIAANNAGQAAILKALTDALSNRKGAHKQLASDQAGVRTASGVLAGAKVMVRALDHAAAGANDTLFHVDGLLYSEDAKVRKLQSQIDATGAERKALLAAGIGADQSRLAVLDRQIADLESQKARTQKDLTTLEALRRP